MATIKYLFPACYVAYLCTGRVREYWANGFLLAHSPFGRLPLLNRRNQMLGSGTRRFLFEGISE